jgi:hypothetical protein
MIKLQLKSGSPYRVHEAINETQLDKYDCLLTSLDIHHKEIS